MYIADNCPKGKGKIMIDVYTEEDVESGKRKKDDKASRCVYHKRFKCHPGECHFHPGHGKK